MNLRLKDLFTENDETESTTDFTLESLQEDLGISIEDCNTLYFETKDSELQAALEALDQDLEKLDLLATWQRTFNEQGICVSSVESLIELFPDFAGKYDLSMYTEQPSKVNLEYGLESLDRIANSILETIKNNLGLIITALIGVVGYFVSRWLVRRAAKRMVNKVTNAYNKALTESGIKDFISKAINDTASLPGIKLPSLEDGSDHKFTTHEQDKLSEEITRVFNDAINMFGNTITNMLDSLDEQRGTKSTFDDIKEEIINKDSVVIMEKIERLIEPYGKEFCKHFRHQCTQLLHRIVSEQITKHQLDRKYNLLMDDLIVHNDHYSADKLIRTLKVILGIQLDQLILLKQELNLLKDSASPNLGASQASHIISELEKLFFKDDLHLTACSLEPIFALIKRKGGELPLEDTDYQQVTKPAEFKYGKFNNFWGYHGTTILNSHNNNVIMFNAPFWSKTNKPVLNKALDLSKVPVVNLDHYEADMKLLKYQAEGLNGNLKAITAEITQLSSIDILKPEFDIHSLKIPETIINDEKSTIVWPINGQDGTTLFEVKRHGNLIRNNYLLNNRLLVIRRLSSMVSDILKTVDRAFNIQHDREHF